MNGMMIVRIGNLVKTYCGPHTSILTTCMIVVGNGLFMGVGLLLVHNYYIVTFKSVVWSIVTGSNTTIRTLIHPALGLTVHTKTL
jgi:hypothetical protein